MSGEGPPSLGIEETGCPEEVVAGEDDAADGVVGIAAAHASTCPRGDRVSGAPALDITPSAGESSSTLASAVGTQRAADRITRAEGINTDSDDDDDDLDDEEEAGGGVRRARASRTPVQYDGKSVVSPIPMNHLTRVRNQSQLRPAKGPGSMNFEADFKELPSSQTSEWVPSESSSPMPAPGSDRMPPPDSGLQPGDEARLEFFEGPEMPSEELDEVLEDLAACLKERRDLLIPQIKAAWMAVDALQLISKELDLDKLLTPDELGRVMAQIAVLKRPTVRSAAAAAAASAQRMGGEYDEDADPGAIDDEEAALASADSDDEEDEDEEDEDEDEDEDDAVEDEVAAEAGVGHGHRRRRSRSAAPPKSAGPTKRAAAYDESDDNDDDEDEDDGIRDKRSRNRSRTARKAEAHVPDTEESNILLKVMIGKPSLGLGGKVHEAVALLPTISFKMPVRFAYLQGGAEGFESFKRDLIEGIKEHEPSHPDVTGFHQIGYLQTKTNPVLLSEGAFAGWAAPKAKPPDKTSTFKTLYAFCQANSDDDRSRSEEPALLNEVCIKALLVKNHKPMIPKAKPGSMPLDRLCVMFQSAVRRQLYIDMSEMDPAVSMNDLLVSIASVVREVIDPRPEGRIRVKEIGLFSKPTPVPFGRPREIIEYLTKAKCATPKEDLFVVFDDELGAAEGSQADDVHEDSHRSDLPVLNAARENACMDLMKMARSTKNSGKKSSVWANWDVLADRGTMQQLKPKLVDAFARSSRSPAECPLLWQEVDGRPLAEPAVMKDPEQPPILDGKEFWFNIKFKYKGPDGLYSQFDRPSEASYRTALPNWDRVACRPKKEFAAGSSHGGGDRDECSSDERGSDSDRDSDRRSRDRRDRRGHEGGRDRRDGSRARRGRSCDRRDRRRDDSRDRRRDRDRGRSRRRDRDRSRDRRRDRDRSGSRRRDDSRDRRRDRDRSGSHRRDDSRDRRRDDSRDRRRDRPVYRRYSDDGHPNGYGAGESGETEEEAAAAEEAEAEEGQ
jgi:hypothetical protein